MNRLPVAEEDRRSVADWYQVWGDRVAAVAALSFPEMGLII